MADVISFEDKISQLKEKPINQVLSAVSEESSQFKDFLIFFKTEEDEHLMFYTDNLSLSDKAVFIQMLQHEIFNELNASAIDPIESDI